MQSVAPPIAVIDTGVWIDVFLHHAILDPNTPYTEILAALEQDLFRPAYSPYCRDELRWMLIDSRLSKKYRISRDAVERFVSIIFYCPTSVFVEFEEHGRYCSDPDDDPIIETAMRAQADYLVAKNGHFREPSANEALRDANVQLCYPDEFLDKLVERL